MRLLLCFLLAIAGVGNASVLDQSKIGYAPLFQEDLEILELAEQTIDQKIKQYKERRDLYRAKAIGFNFSVKIYWTLKCIGKKPTLMMKLQINFNK
jgi:hypothetical protein